MISKGIKCKECGKPFLLKEEGEYTLSYCDKCDILVVIYKINPAVLFRKRDEKPIFISSDQNAKCRKCNDYLTVKDGNSYISARCNNCGFAIIYRMSSHRGVARFISGDEFDKTKYWTSGRRQAEREKRDSGK